MSTPRKLMLVALTIHLISLFFLYNDSVQQGMVPVYMATGKTQYYPAYSDPVTGFKHRPVAVYIIIALMLAYLTKICEDPAWRQWGYWASLGLLIYFCVGGAVIRTTGGNLSLVSIGIVLIAAIINMNQNKHKPKQPADVKT